MIRIAQETTADEVLTGSPFALLMGMMLDQQYPMEHAFRGPGEGARPLRVARPGRPRGRGSRASSPRLCTVPPAVHRFPGSMAARIQALARVVVEEYDGHAERLWQEADSGRELMRRLQALPGFGKQKAQIFTALLGKQLDVRPDGWQEAAGDYAEPGSHRSVADVVDQASLDAVRAFKKEKKRAAAAG